MPHGLSELYPDTERFDPGCTVKAERYRELPSLQAYLLVDSRSRGAAIWRRSVNEWVFGVVGETFGLPCPTVTLNLADFYDGTSL